MAARVDRDALSRRVDELVVAAAARAGDAPAVVFRGETLTYDALVARADAIAAALAAGGVRRGDIVGVHLRRSADMVAALLGVMRAGAAYVPLDPQFPAERLAYMAEDSGLKIVVTASGAAGFAPPAGVKLLALDRIGRSAGAFAPPEASSSDLIYLLYTSGSTGRPKGVAVAHANVVNFLLSMAQEPGMAASDRMLAVTTISFDISGLEIFLPLVLGASLVVAEEDDALDGGRMKALIARHGATMMQATPTTWRVLLEAGFSGGGGFKALVGGEALPADLARRLASRCGEVWNMYGPTETTIWSACWRLPASGEPVLLGAPIANTGVYVLDKAGNPQPPGVVGEICIGGAGVAVGYWRREELTAEKFVADPFMAEFGGRMYRTGDSGRYVQGGFLEFRGRIDGQVKVRGFRVELGEIEAALAEQQGVRAAAAKLFDAGDGDARIAAYVEPEAGAAPGVQALREALRARLPHYMIPQHIMTLDALPLTPNGKIDRSRLPPPAQEAARPSAHVEPANEAERAIARVFGEVLGLRAVSADADFFDLGGHSILAIRALALLRRDLDPALDLQTLFDAGNVRDLARSLASRHAQEPVLETFEF
jgi:amino acid adenylation domain-containing protein